MKNSKVLAAEFGIGVKVRINIKNRDGYTSDLYKSIQGEVGEIVQKQGKLSCYKNAWLVKFGKTAQKKYAKTHGGKWGMPASDPDYRMEWWTEENDMEVI